METALPVNEMTTLIHSTLQETLDVLGKRLEALRAAGTTTTEQAEGVISETHHLVVFLKHAGDYLRRGAGDASLREEMVRLKLHLLSVLRGLADSVRAGDALAMHDLLTEELRDNLSLWKIQVLPRLRSASRSS
jgi:hypothetical protein